eukprot:scaffold1509_cov240-Pinguiococcus_pyrenoidosus.AAC.46
MSRLGAMVIRFLCDLPWAFLLSHGQDSPTRPLSSPGGPDPSQLAPPCWSSLARARFSSRRWHKKAETKGGAHKRLRLQGQPATSTLKPASRRVRCHTSARAALAVAASCRSRRVRNVSRICGPRSRVKHHGKATYKAPERRDRHLLDDADAANGIQPLESVAQSQQGAVLLQRRRSADKVLQIQRHGQPSSSKQRLRAAKRWRKRALIPLSMPFFSGRVLESARPPITEPSSAAGQTGKC